MSKTMQIMTAAFILLLLIVANKMDSSTEEDEHQTYCDMVQAYRADVSKGWPDYKGIYDEECKNKAK